MTEEEDLNNKLADAMDRFLKEVTPIIKRLKAIHQERQSKWASDWATMKLGIVQIIQAEHKRASRKRAKK